MSKPVNAIRVWRCFCAKPAHSIIVGAIISSRETDKHAEKGGDKDQQWREFRELLPEHSRDNPLTAVVDQLFADASVQDPGILLEGTIWLVPIRSAMGTRVSVRRG